MDLCKRESLVKLSHVPGTVCGAPGVTGQPVQPAAEKRANQCATDPFCKILQVKARIALEAPSKNLHVAGSPAQQTVSYLLGLIGHLAAPLAEVEALQKGLAPAHLPNMEELSAQRIQFSKKGPVPCKLVLRIASGLIGKTGMFAR